MLNSLHLQNFQSHEDTVLEFGPGVNAIIGTPDSGKTAILRSLIWVLHNRPLGTGYIRKGQDGDCEVQVQTESVQVSRKRGSVVNTYEVKGGGGDAEYKSFGSSPPKEIVEALNLEDINLQPQHSNYFLVFDSPGSIAQYVRSSTGLAVIDEACSCLKGLLHSTRVERKQKGEDLDKENEDIRRIDKMPLEELDQAIQEAERLNARREELSRTISGLRSLCQQLAETRSTKITIPSDIDESLHQMEVLINLRIAKSTETSQLLAAVTGLQAVINSAIILPDEDISSQAMTLVSQYNDISRAESDLRNLITTIDDCHKLGEKLSQKIDVSQHECQELMEQLTQCPYCSGDLTPARKRQLVEGSNGQ